ncbi:MAG: hypothetical protein ABEK10_02970 [Candidatus Nanosalina sp.]
MSKGQGKYIIGVFVMIAAISIGMMGQFATRYVLEQAFINMNENYVRYESLTHSYMVLNNGVNNVENHTEMSEDLIASPRCRFDSGVVINEGERYRIAFTALETDFSSSGDCSYTIGHYFDEPDFKSPHLASIPYMGVYPDMALWSPGDGGGRGKSFYMHTRVKPER